MKIVVDSDGLIGSLNPEDIHYQTSQKILTMLLKKGAQLIYPATVIAESVTFLQGRLNNPELAKLVVQWTIDNKLNIETIDNMVLQKAALLMNFKGGKHHTLFDCIVAAVAEDQHADAIFSFDKFYKSQGFKLASDLPELDLIK